MVQLFSKKTIFSAKIGYLLKLNFPLES